MTESIETDERYTPEQWLKPWKDFFGPRFVDVANNDTNTTGATRTFTKNFPAHSGAEWAGAADEADCSWIWANVPYSLGSIMGFVSMLVDPWMEGLITVPMVWLLPVDPSAKWYQLLVEMTAWVAYPRQRIRFHGAEGKSGAKQPSQCMVVMPPGQDGAGTRGHFVSAHGSMFTTVRT